MGFYAHCIDKGFGGAGQPTLDHCDGIQALAAPSREASHRCSNGSVHFAPSFGSIANEREFATTTRALIV
jgi:hypothetical protein